jgi:hypothetical protein
MLCAYLIAVFFACKTTEIAWLPSAKIQTGLFFMMGSLFCGSTPAKSFLYAATILLAGFRRIFALKISA